MAANSTSDSSLFLFRKESGDPITFFIRPSATKARVKPLITATGGIITSRLRQGYIKLAVEGDKVTSNDYVTVQFIYDCIKANQLLQMDTYRVVKQEPDPPSSDTSTVSNISFNGRSQYTRSEDNAILAYVASHTDCSVSGNRLWKQMELIKTTHHSWQSMKCRFLNKLVQDLPKFLNSQEQQKLEDEKDVVAHSSTSKQETSQTTSSSDGDSVYKDCLLQVKEEYSPKRDTQVRSSSQETEMFGGTPEKRLQMRKRRLRTCHTRSNEDASTEDTACDSTSRAVDSASASSPRTPGTLPKYRPRGAYESSCGSNSDFDNFLLQAAEESTPMKAQTACSTEDFGTPTEAAGGQPQTRKMHRGKRRRSRHADSGGVEELVAGVLADVDTCSDSDSTGSFPKDPEFQEEVNNVTTFVKEVTEDYTVPAITVMQLLYFHNLDMDAVLDHIEKGESDVVWTKANDEKLNSGNPEDLQKLIDKYGQDRVMKRQAFFNGP